MRQFLAGWGMIFISALCDSLTAFIVKRRFNELGPMDLGSVAAVVGYGLTFLRSPLVVFALVIFFLAPALWFVALNRIDLSVGYPALVGFHLLFICFLGVLFLGEPMTARKLFAVVMILASIVLLYMR
jgi:multidrug transporter EmrE-like cation transporter